MKKIKIIFTWVLISIFLQCSLLFFLNNFFFTSDGNIKSKKVEMKKEDKKQLANIRIPDDAKDIKTSFDGKYLSYYQDGIINAVNVRDGKSVEMSNSINCKILNYSWLSDRHRMLVAQRNNESGVVSLYYFDVAKNQSNIITNICKLDANGQVNSINASTLTDVTYIMITRGNKSKSIYRLDINQELTREHLMCKDIGTIDIIPHEDRLLYDDYINKEVHATSPNMTLNFADNNRLRLIGVDAEDRVFIGQLNKQNLITKIKYGILKEKTSIWKTINLDKATSKDNIILNLKGDIFLNDELEGKIKDLNNNKEYLYKGTLISIFDSGYSYLDEGQLKINFFN